MPDDGLDEREGRTGVCGERDEGVPQGVESDFGAVPFIAGILYACLDAAGLEDFPDLDAEGDAVRAAVFLRGFGKDLAHALVLRRLAEHGGQDGVDGYLHAGAMPDGLDGYERDESTDQIDVSPLQGGAVAEAEPRVDSDREEDAHFTLERGADAFQLLDRQFAAGVDGDALLLDFLPGIVPDEPGFLLQSLPHAAEEDKVVVERAGPNLVGKVSCELVDDGRSDGTELDHVGVVFLHPLDQRVAVPLVDAHRGLAAVGPAH